MSSGLVGVFFSSHLGGRFFLLIEIAHLKGVPTQDQNVSVKYNYYIHLESCELLQINHTWLIKRPKSKFVHLSTKKWNLLG